MSMAVEAKDLGKMFVRRRDVQRTFKSFALGRVLNRDKGEDFWAVKDVSFSVSQGETLGIIGSNGAGKSTLLSLIARTTAPTKGNVKVNGRMSTLLELGAGFHPDLTGRENVFLNASILGMTRKETEEKYDEIVEFSGIKDAIDTPVKFFSSGMYVRLGFSVAVMCNPDVLLMDEILAVGDESFRKKSLSRIEQFKVAGKAMLIVSHDLETIKRMADRVLLLDEGKVIELGESLSVVDHYKNFGIYQEGAVTIKEFGSREIIMENIIFKSNGSPVNDDILEGEKFSIEIKLRSKVTVSDPVVGFGITDNIGNILYGTNTQIQGASIGDVNGEKNIHIDMPNLNLQRGIYYISLSVHNQSHKIQYHRLDNFFKMKVKSKTLSDGILHLPCQFSIF